VPTGIYVGTEDGLYILGAERRVELPGRRVRALTAGPDGLCAVVGESEIFTSGATGIWRHVVRLRDARVTCVHSGSDGILVGTMGARLHRVEDRTVHALESFDAVDGRAKWHTPSGDPPSIRSIDVDDDGTIYVNVHIGGIPRSTDGGLTWRPTIDSDEQVFQVLAVRGNGPLLAATARGLATSWDHAHSWNHRTLGLAGTYCRAVAVCGDTVLLSASPTADGASPALYRGGLEGVRFDRCERGLPETLPGTIDTFCLSAAGSTAAFGTSEGALYVTQDAGRSWELLADDLPPVLSVLVRE
jgi:hypothetical protein